MPETKHACAWTFPNGELLQERVVVLHELLLHPVGKRTFDGKQQALDSGSMLGGKDQQMDVLWHVHKGDQPKALLRDGVIESPREELFPIIVQQEWKTVVARERQLMAMMGFVDVTDLLSMGKIVHGAKNKRLGMGGQATIMGRHYGAPRVASYPCLLDYTGGPAARATRSQFTVQSEARADQPPVAPEPARATQERQT